MAVEKVAEDEAPKQGGSQKKMRACQIYLLNGQEFRCEVPKVADGSQLLDQIYDLLDLFERDYFGLYFKDLTDNKYWLEPNKSIKKQLKNGPWSFYFAVKFYPPDPSQLQEDITRYYMVLQIRDDIVGGRLPCSFVTHSLLGSYVVQSELGDFDRAEMKRNYVSNFSFAPNQTNVLEERVMELHKTHRGQTPEQAELNFLEIAKKLPLYGVDLHMAQDSENVEILVGISWSGVSVYRDGTQINRFSWPRIVKLSYVRSKFYVTLRSLDQGEMHLSMIGFKLQNHRSAKCLWKSAVEHHSFFRLVRNEATQPSKFFRVGSKFRYSGRTQHETRRAISGPETRRAPTVKRTHSMRLRSDGGEISPVKAPLPPVSEEEPSPPKLPEKERKSQVHEVVETKTVTEVETVKEVKTTSSSISSSTESLHSNKEEDNELNRSRTLSEHQKQIHQMKVETDESSVDFLRSPHPNKSLSHDSLDDLDARLPPKKPPRLSEYRKSSSLISQPDNADERSAKVVTETVVTETVVVVKEELVEKKENATEPEAEEQPDRADDDKSSDNFHSIESNKCSSQSSIAPEAEIDQDSKVTTSSLSSSSRSSSPSSGKAEEHFLSNENEEEAPHPLVEDQQLNLSSSSSSSSKSSISEQGSVPPGITTVETRTVRVEDVIIPHQDNEVHEISLVDENDSLAVNPTEGSLSSLSSATTNSTSADKTEDHAAFSEPPLVKTEAVVVESYVEDVPEGTTSPPVVHTQTKTITYESKTCVQSRDAAGDDVDPIDSADFNDTHTQLISSQIISSQTESTITTTEITKVTRGGVSETHIEKQLVSTGPEDIDHYQAMVDTIIDTQASNPNHSITKVVLEEEGTLLGEQQQSG